MKVLLFLAIVATVRGAALHYAPAAAVLETGESAQFRSEDNIGNYDFGYNEDHTSGGSFRREVGDAHGNVAGSYGLRDADGRVRIVNYIANDDGFKADIKTNEPGVEPADPADATINKAAPLVLAADVPVAVAHPAPAPIVAVPEPHPTALKSIHAFPAPVAAVKSSTFSVAEPVVAPLAISEAKPLAYAFPEPAAVPVAKTAVVQPAPAAVTVSRSSVSVAEHVPTTYAFPAPAAVPVSKSSSVSVEEHVAVAKPAHVSYAFPAPAAVPVAKSTVTVAEHAPAAYAFPAPAAVPVAKSTVTVAEHAPAAYAFPAPAAVPVAKSSYSVVETSPVASKSSSVTVQETAPISYTFPAPAAVPVAKSSLVYNAPHALAVPTSGFSYSTRVINRAPIHYGIGGPLAYAPAHYAVKNDAFPYVHNPIHYRLYSPVVSYAGPVLGFNHIEYPGFPVVKKK